MFVRVTGSLANSERSVLLRSWATHALSNGTSTSRTVSRSGFSAAGYSTSRTIGRNGFSAVDYFTSRTIGRNGFVAAGYSTKLAPTNNDTAPKRSMTWPEFFSLRRKIQLVQRLAGIPFVVAFWVAEGFVLSLPIFDPTKTIFDLDPMVVVGLGSVVGSIASYFVGTAISSLAWRLLRPHQVRQLDLKQKDFYARVSKYRANVPPNPTQMNFNFDFYGEKVRSVSDYRSWLRRQRQLVADRRFAV